MPSGTLSSPFAVLLREFTANILLAAVEDLGLGKTAACFPLPQARKRPSADFAFSARVGDVDGRAPMGISVEQLWSSGRRCLRQYCLLQVGQATPTDVSVFMYILQLGCEHWEPVNSVGLPAAELLVVVGESGAVFRFAHSPARGHL